MLRRKRFRHLAHIGVVGIGKGGITAVNHMIAAGITSVDFVTVDSDRDALAESRAPLTIHLSETLSGGKLQEEITRPAGEAPEKCNPLRDAVSGSDMVFVVGGLGGKAGVQLAPLVAQAAQFAGALTTAIVTFPFHFEGKQRAQRARKAIRRLRPYVNTLIVIPNDRLLTLAGGELAFHETYHLALEIWQQSILGISELVNAPGLVNVDFADVRSIMSAGGASIIATGAARGPHRAREAARQATRSPHLDVTIDGARGVLFNVTGGLDLTLHHVRQAAAVIRERVHPEANIIFGAAIDVAMEGALRITVVATGCGFEPFEGGVRSAGHEGGEVPRQDGDIPRHVEHVSHDAGGTLQFDLDNVSPVTRRTGLATTIAE